MKIVQLFRPYLRYLEIVNRSRDTIHRQKLDLTRFADHLAARGITEVEDLGKNAALGYQEELASVLTAKGEGLRIRSQATILISVRGFLKWLHREDYLAFDLSRVIQLPKKDEPLPKEVIEPDEMRKLMRMPDLSTPHGYRDRAILEVLYSTGVRLNEVIHLRVHDLDRQAGFLYVYRGKGGKDRMVPIGKVAAEFVRGYVLEVRPKVSADGSTDILFLTRYGKKMSKHAVDHMVRTYARRAGIRKRITPHCFRVTCVTGMLRNGAPVKHLQEMLGHKRIDTLDPYLKLTATELKAMHERYHPRERLGP